MSPTQFEISSYTGPYQAFLGSTPAALFERLKGRRAFFVIDERVAELHAEALAPVLKPGDRPFQHVLVKATEENKSYQKIEDPLNQLLQQGIRRSDVLVAVGGGIIQDMSCFIASTLFRGMEWFFLPTTLLAQADSCIGSKSSINFGSYKNLLGTFYPPREVHVCSEFLKTLTKDDLLSGIGEIFKITLIDGLATFDEVAREFPLLPPTTSDYDRLSRVIAKSLQIKKGFIEKDEWDKGIRNILNYGHSFGHAVESATHFAIPHGISVMIGMDMANFVAAKLGRIPAAIHEKIHPTLRAGFKSMDNVAVPFEEFSNALSKDKKNTHAELGLILMDSDLKIKKQLLPKSPEFLSWCKDYFSQERFK